jgi:hypothetical protein
MIYGIYANKIDYCVNHCGKLAGGKVVLENETFWLCPHDYCPQEHEDEGPVGILPEIGEEIILRIFTSEEAFSEKFGKTI